MFERDPGVALGFKKRWNSSFGSTPPDPFAYYPGGYDSTGKFHGTYSYVYFSLLDRALAELGFPQARFILNRQSGADLYFELTGRKDFGRKKLIKSPDLLASGAPVGQFPPPVPPDWGETVVVIGDPLPSDTASSWLSWIRLFDRYLLADLFGSVNESVSQELAFTSSSRNPPARTAPDRTTQTKRTRVSPGGAKLGPKFDDSWARSHQEAREPSQDDLNRTKMDEIFSYDLSPDKTGFQGEDYFTYALVYGLKQSIYNPIKAQLLGEKPKYLDSNGNVQTVPWQPDRSGELAVAYGQIASIFLPIPKALKTDSIGTSALAAERVGGRAAIAVEDLGAFGRVTGRRSFRRLLTSRIGEESHPLHGLLNAEGKLTSSTTRGMDRLTWFENPYIVEAGHFESARRLAGAPDRLVMMSAYENRLLSAALEHPSIGGEMLESGNVLSIGGVPVDFRTATALVEYGLLDPEIFANAPLVIY